LGHKLVVVGLVESLQRRFTQVGLLGELLDLLSALSRASRETRAEQTLHKLVGELDSVERVFFFDLLLEDHHSVVDFEQDVFHLRILALTLPLLEKKMALNVKHVVADGSVDEAHQHGREHKVSDRRGIEGTFRLVSTDLVLH